MKILSRVIVAAIASGCLLIGGAFGQDYAGSGASGLKAAVEAIHDPNLKRGPGTVAVEALNGSIDVGADEVIMQGPAARQFMQLAYGIGHPQADAIVVQLGGPFRGAAVTYKFLGVGHIASDSWGAAAKADPLLTLIKRRSEEDNKVRPSGFSKVYVDSWVEEPFFDKQTGVAYWAYSFRDGKDRRYVSARAIKLGRNGFTLIRRIVAPGRFASVRETMRPVLEAYRIDEGQRYGDYKRGARSEKVHRAGLGDVIAILASGSRIDDSTRKQRKLTIRDLNKLKWYPGGKTYGVTASNAYIRVRDNQSVMIGRRDATDYLKITGWNLPAGADALVKTVDGPDVYNVTAYHRVKSGHVSMDDWESQIQPRPLLAEIQKKYDKEDAKRPPRFAKHIVDRWIQEPVLDREKGIVSWAIEGHTNTGHKFMDVQAIKLDRTGYSHIRRIGGAKGFVSVEQSLLPAVDAYLIPEGSRYADFKPGTDEVAKAGLGEVIVDTLTKPNFDY